MRAQVKDGIIYSPYPGFEIRNCSFYQILKECMTKYANKKLAVDGNIEMCGSEILRSAELCAACLQQHGILPRDFICVHFLTGLNNLVVMLGALSSGATVVLSSPTFTTRELLYQLTDTGAPYIITDRHNAQKVREALERFPIKKAFSVDDVPGFTSLNDCAMDGTFKEHEVADSSEEVLAILYSSGSTGLPKGMNITHRNFYCSLHTLKNLNLVAEDDVHMAWSPITHVSGFGLTLKSLLLGARCIIEEPSTPVHDIVKSANLHKVTFWAGFPVKLQVLMNEMEKQRLRLNPVKKLAIGGTSVPDALGHRLVKVFHPTTLINAYGQSETMGLLTSTPVGEVTYSNVGVPTANNQVKIIDPETGMMLGCGERGEICARTPAMMKGYFRRPEATEAAMTPDGWLRTGDAGYYDQDGRLHVADRLKEMIKCLDMQCAPAELEEILLSHEAIAEACVVGVPHSDYGEAPRAFVVLKHPHKQEEVSIVQQLQDLVAKQTAVYKHLYGGVFVLETLPKTGNGKIDRKQLRMTCKAAAD
uniref:Putative acyl-coa synthetase n=1 Tax=Ornithodoros turicata TaxID=34597 RepID=A0A2R5L3W7_9ACAR